MPYKPHGFATESETKTPLATQIGAIHYANDLLGHASMVTKVTFTVFTWKVHAQPPPSNKSANLDMALHQHQPQRPQFFPNFVMIQQLAILQAEDHGGACGPGRSTF
jgi:hypothetical protein